MSIFNFFKKKIKSNKIQVDEVPKTVISQKKEVVRNLEPQINAKLKFSLQPGKAKAQKVELDFSVAQKIRKHFISFDIETTGLSPTNDRIIEIGAVVFSDGKIVDSFSSLVNPGIVVPQSAIAVNHISNEVLSDAPTEMEIYPKFSDFLGSALQGDTIMCAHNATFDFGFLCNTLSRLGYDANILYLDTLALSRRFIPELQSHRQCDIEAFLGLKNENTHRAKFDAENCGHIMYHLLDYAEEILKQEKIRAEKEKPSEQELEVCAYVQKMIEERGGDCGVIRYRRNAEKYVCITCFYPFLKFKFTKRGNYILISSKSSKLDGFVIRPSTEKEGGLDFVRVFFSNPAELAPLSETIYHTYLNGYANMQEYIECNSRGEKNVADSLQTMFALSAEDVSLLLKSAQERDYASAVIPKTELSISRDDVTIAAIHKRVPLDKIQNKGNKNKGFEEGFPYWERGEVARKEGKLLEAVELFDSARYYGYNSAPLYTSYAMAFRQLKDYDNEIVILEEAILRNPTVKSTLEARKTKALTLLYNQQKAIRIVEEKRRKQTEKAAQKKLCL